MWRLLLVLCLVARAAAADDGLVIGDYKLVRVVDGDTIRVEGLDNSLRLLGLDTEETFKHAKERRAYAAGWDSYVRDARGGSRHPAKFATPMGDEAKAWAEQFFAGVRTVRLERDDAEEIRDRYHRYLAYVLVEKGGKWLNYNVEAVRAGMAPYFPKYGRSRRYHEAFVQAEAEAKAAHRGIWDPSKQAYPDYPEREAWWAARGEFMERARAAGAIDLTHEHAERELAEKVGTPVDVVATVGRIYPGKPVRVMLDGRRDLPVIFFDGKLYDDSHLSAWQGEYVMIHAAPRRYHGHLEVVVERLDQIRFSELPGAHDAAP
ncbi:MAG TPA: thermonuclease family protein [Kofleriaceae bacterium]|nr:thermonuclease family protein [Kofleriaceae bacterium]